MEEISGFASPFPPHFSVEFATRIPPHFDEKRSVATMIRRLLIRSKKFDEKRKLMCRCYETRKLPKMQSK
jgi:hypothetical protein